MVTRFLALLLLAGVLPGCSLYPFGHSKFGPYYGGQGPGPKATEFVPRKVAERQP